MSTLVARHARGIKIPVCTVLLIDCFLIQNSVLVFVNSLKFNMKISARVLVLKCIFSSFYGHICLLSFCSIVSVVFIKQGNRSNTKSTKGPLQNPWKISR